MSRGGRLAALLYGAGGLVYGADRLTKVWAEQVLAERGPIVVIPRVLQLNYTTNAGGAFGLFGGQPWLFFGATLAICAFIVALSGRPGSALSAGGLGLILGGALGNLTDRILHGPGVSGRVTDFVDLHVWPVFNLADSAIVVGALLVVLGSLRRERATGPA